MFVALHMRGVEAAARLLSATTLSLAARCGGSTLARKKRFLSSNASMAYSTEEHGTCFSTDYVMYLKHNSTIVSPFHDIPLMADHKNKVYNMVVEIPRWTNAKMEISTKDKMNPIKQDMKKGKVRFVKNSFPYKGYIWNYGAIPQTWEDPTETDEHTGQKGDGDPIDVLDIGNKVSFRGEVKQVKVLGIMALIDEGETDWKVVAIDVNDPLAEHLNDIDDVRKKMPGIIEATREWFRIYKMPAGNPPNEFAFDGEVKDRAFANEIIMQTHGQWKKLINKEIDNVKKLACENVKVDSSPYKIKEEEANGVTKGKAARTNPVPLPEDVDMMYYLTAEQKGGS